MASSRTLRLDFGNEKINLMPINPSFHRFPNEAALIGRLLAAFGELEISVCDNAQKATGIGNSVLWVGWRLPGERFCRQRRTDWGRKDEDLCTPIDGSRTHKRPLAAIDSDDR